MPRDAVLRCAGFFRKNGRTQPLVVDTVDEGGDYYTLVFEWAKVAGMDGEYPSKRVLVHKSRVEVQIGNQNFELRLCDCLNLDEVETKDVELRPEAFKARPNEFFQPSPEPEKEN